MCESIAGIPINKYHYIKGCTEHEAIYRFFAVENSHVHVVDKNEFKDLDTELKLKCMRCGHEQTKTPRSVLTSRSERWCNNCANDKNPRTLEIELKRRISGKPYQYWKFHLLFEMLHPRLVLKSDYTTSVEKVDMECLDCGTKFDNKPKLITGQRCLGCPTCAIQRVADKNKSTNRERQDKESRELLKESTTFVVRRIDHETALLGCKTCAHEWPCTYKRIKNYVRSGCKKCTTSETGLESTQKTFNRLVRLFPKRKLKIAGPGQAEIECIRCKNVSVRKFPDIENNGSKCADCRGAVRSEASFRVKKKKLEAKGFFNITTKTMQYNCTECGDKHTRIIPGTDVSKLCVGQCLNCAAKSSTKTKRTIRLDRLKKRYPSSVFSVSADLNRIDFTCSACKKKVHLHGNQIRSAYKNKRVPDLSCSQCTKENGTKLVSVYGSDFRCRGYEHYVLYNLAEVKGIDPKQIKIEASSFRYFDSEKQKTRTHIPDIFLPNNNIIEVKSTFTAGLKGNRHSLKNLRDKQKRAHKLGYKYTVAVVLVSKKVDSQPCIVYLSLEDMKLSKKKLLNHILRQQELILSRYRGRINIFAASN